MIIWVIWWLFDWFQVIDWLFDDYLWLFVWILDYLMIIWLIIWWLLFWILDYLMIIWCLFDDYSNYLTITCHFVAPRPVGSLRLDRLEMSLQWHLLRRLIAVLIPQPRPTHYHAGPAYIVGYKLLACQAAMERPIWSHQQDLALALAAALALLRRDDPLDPGPWTPTCD